MNTRQFLTNWLEHIWYGSRPLERTLLLPFSALFKTLSQRRRQRLSAWQRPVPVPVIIIGNIAIGGTGKTPLTIRLAQLLRQHGYYPGIVSRGYGSRSAERADGVMAVGYQSKPEEVGDEALLMAARTALPVVVGAERVRAVDYLLDNYEVDVVLSDDGLQHYKLARDMEIVVVDGVRRCGNGYCLPAGPLREQPQRMAECDFVVCNGEAQPGEHAMQLSGSWLVSVTDTRVTRPLSEFNGQAAHAVTAIGHPQRFLQQLNAAGLVCERHFYPDHYLFSGDEFTFADQLPVLMTEKDAVKCQQFSREQLRNCWYLPVDARLDAAFEQAFLASVAEVASTKGQ